MPNGESPALTVTRVPSGSGVPLIRVAGEIDMSTVAQLRHQLAASNLSVSLVIDLSEVAFCGVVGVRALLTTAERVRASGSRLCVVVGTRAVRRALTVCDIEGQLQTYATLDEALIAATLPEAHPEGR